MHQWLVTAAVVLLGGFLVFYEVESCNEAVCGSVVSKCLLTQSCKCDLKNCSCCKDCSNCLSFLYSECCSCVDMCPKPNNSDIGLSKKSHVEDYKEPVPGLFNVLTDSPDSSDRWNSFVYPIDIDISDYSAKHTVKMQMQTAEQEVAPMKTPSILTVNCSVAFWHECVSWAKCRNNCQSMGSNSYRWFHDGCCECVGQHCVNYGINESRCKKCPLPLTEENLQQVEEEEEDEDATYGEDDEDEEENAMDEPSE